MFGEDSYADTYFGGSSLAGNTYTLSLADTITPVDSIVKTTTKALQGSITLNEVFSHISTLQRVLVDSVTLSEVVVIGKQRVLLFTEVISLVDNQIKMKLNGITVRWFKIPKILTALWTKAPKPPIQSG